MHINLTKCVIFVVFALYAFSVTAAPTTTIQVISGTYVAVSESEWSETLYLNPDGSAKLINESWVEDDPNSRSTEVYMGQWAENGAHIELTLKIPTTNGSFTSHTEYLKYSPQLTLENIGRPGSLPGVYSVNSPQTSPLWSVNLWAEKEIKNMFEKERSMWINK